MAIDIREYLKKDKFKEWLEAQPEGSFVGRREEADSCPIACYIKNQIPGVEVEVDGISITGSVRLPTVYPDYDDFELKLTEEPEAGWVKCFVEYVDKKPAELDIGERVRLLTDEEYEHWTQATREESLDILEKC